MVEQNKVHRAKKIMDETISLLQLDLSDLNVLTEAGSNNFIYTPMIAYCAGARRTFVWIKDTPYGKANDIQAEFEAMAALLQLDLSRFEFATNQRPLSHIREADIVTNLGFVRPIDKDFISHLSPKAVVSYMCEAWEIREQDVDIAYCKKRGVKVGGVWENHPDLMIFEGCGALSVKLCLEAGCEVYQNKILVLSSDKFGKTAAESFLKFGAASVIVKHPGEVKDLKFSEFDLVFVADYNYEEEIIGKTTQSQLEHCKQMAVVHLCGKVDFDFLKSSNIYCYPQQPGLQKRMTRTLAHLGPKPVIDLHVAGHKVGECLYKNIPSDLVQTI